CLDHDAHNPIHGHARLIRQKKGLSGLVRGNQRNAVSEEWRQFSQPSNVSGLKQIVLVGKQLVLAEGRELKSAAQGERRDPCVLITKRRSTGNGKIRGGFRG